MGKVPVRLKEVVYTLSPFQQGVMGGLWKDLPHKANHYFSLVSGSVASGLLTQMPADLTNVIFNKGWGLIMVGLLSAGEGCRHLLRAASRSHRLLLCRLQGEGEDASPLLSRP